MKIERLAKKRKPDEEESYNFIRMKIMRLRERKRKQDILKIRQIEDKEREEEEEEKREKQQLFSKIKTPRDIADLKGEADPTIKNLKSLMQLDLMRTDYLMD